MAAYGIKKGDPAFASESACVALLMKLYQALTGVRNGRDPHEKGCKGLVPLTAFCFVLDRQRFTLKASKPG